MKRGLFVIFILTLVFLIPNGYAIFTQPDDTLPKTYNPQSLNRYMFNLGNPYKYTDPTGREPVRSQAGKAEEVFEYIHNLEQQNPDLSANQVLEIAADTYGSYEQSSISNKGGDGYSPNFVYTEQYGVIDQRHFFVNAQKGGSGMARESLRGAEYVLEMGQCAMLSSSCFTYEDLTSNEVGRQFRAGLNDEEPLSQQYSEFMKGAGAGDFPNWIWATMPEEEPGRVWQVSNNKRKYSRSGRAVPRQTSRWESFQSALSSLVRRWAKSKSSG